MSQHPLQHHCALRLQFCHPTMRSPNCRPRKMGCLPWVPTSPNQPLTWASEHGSSEGDFPPPDFGLIPLFCGGPRGAGVLRGCTRGQAAPRPPPTPRIWLTLALTRMVCKLRVNGF